ncbi:SIR2 family protein [Aquihabitans sp. McL0605]|uniref:SIR2 family protein n=1 Tax=Aquihabitans sp. McL0605 TaxID=3415671 RepID=UPI003CF19CE6
MTRLHCDAWLLPTDDWMSTAGDFTTVIEAAEAQKDIEPWADEEQFRALPTSDAADPQVWLGRIGGLDQPASWYADCAEQFIEAAAASAHVRGASGRAVPLLAMPVLGTRYGGGRWDEKGQILEALIERIRSAARTRDVDVVLVTWGEDAARSRAMYAAAQRARQRVLAATPDVADWDLGPNTPALEDAAVRLAGLARSGRLVLFLGAGVSAGAGLPTWQHLIDELARAADLDEDSIESLHRFDLRDQATIVMQDSDDGRDQIVQALDTAHYPLTGALLASLPTTEAITTNYDGLFEAAVEACHQDLVVLPYSAVSEAGQRWLLKLHGSVGRSGVDIVLTRDDYLAAPSRHAALFGLVQAMLLTRHMLFVGYSLGDEDFHKIVHEVRTAQSSASEGGGSVLGSALVLADDPLQARLWSGTISVVPTGPRVTIGDDGDAESVAVAARTLQIFLDRVAFLAADMTGFLLDPDFAGLLNESERKVAEGLSNLAGLAVGDQALAEKLRDLLRRFGG